ncbi:MAG: hypothetical protein QOH90_2071, partial [Actinomycetota bacterium]|nr:hypothetical protein [Actinomycetota bacterium]
TDTDTTTGIEEVTTPTVPALSA